MGTIRNGLLKGIRGRVGPVVVTKFNKEKSIVKILPNKTRKAPKIAQKVQRARFRTGQKFVISANSLISIGYRNNKAKAKPLEAACSYHVKNAVQGEYPDFSIDPSKIIISIDHGGLKHERSAKMSMVKCNIVEVTWDTAGKYNPCELLDRNNDDTLFLLYNETKGTLYMGEKVMRREGTLSRKIPSKNVGDVIHGYFFFAAKDGKVSNSQYLGSIKIAKHSAGNKKVAPDKQ